LGELLTLSSANGGSSAFFVVAAMCLIGTTIINGVLKFDSLFNTVVNFSALFAGAYFANVLARSYQLPGIDSMVMGDIGKCRHGSRCPFPDDLLPHLLQLA
jgi:hypothetical protein